MQNNKILYAVIVVLLMIILVGSGWVWSSYKNKTSETNTVEKSLVPENLSEQSNISKFNEYFSEAYLAKLPSGVKFDPSKIIKTTSFLASDQMCISLTIKKNIPVGNIATAVYDAVSKQYVQSKTTFPQELKQGGSVGCQNINYASGKYEYKIYVGDILVSVLPFEVK